MSSKVERFRIRFEYFLCYSGSAQSRFRILYEFWFLFRHTENEPVVTIDTYSAFEGTSVMLGHIDSMNMSSNIEIGDEITKETNPVEMLSNTSKGKKASVHNKSKSSKILSCTDNDCKYSTAHGWNMMRHQEMHSRVRHTCVDCNAPFSTKYQLLQKSSMGIQFTYANFAQKATTHFFITNLLCMLIRDRHFILDLCT